MANKFPTYQVYRNFFDFDLQYVKFSCDEGKVTGDEQIISIYRKLLHMN